MRKIIMFGFWMIILSGFALASGSIQTGQMAPVAVELCGQHSQYVTITASDILNKENTTLASVTATLVFSNDPGLAFISPQAVNLGNIAPLSYAGSDPSWTVQCSSPNQGIYTAYVNYQTSNSYFGSSIDEATTVLTVHDLNSFTGNISVSEESQEEHQPIVIADSTPTIKVSTNRDALCRGSLDTDESYDNMDFNFYGSQKQHNYTFLSPISQGEHTVYVKCRDELENIMPDSILISFRIDTNQPQITVVSPESVVVGEYVELKVSVDEDAKCRFEEEDESFTGMEDFDVISGNTFSTEFTSLDEDTYTYYVKCRDDVGNIASRQVDFEVEIPPKAEIVFEKEPPLSIGTYEITVIPSKPLRSVPELYYEWETETDEVYRRQVNLVKSGSYYKGFIIIKSEAMTRSGAFDFKATDLSGNDGTEITEGAAFLVDTIPPVAPKDVSIESEEDIKLSWYYDGEKADHFNIYRSKSKDVSPIDLYDKSETNYYEDDNVLANQLYYYKVAAVDIAGNVGAFSTEVSTYAKSGSAASAPIETTNPPTEETRVWKETLEKDIETILIDLDWAETNIRDLESQEQAVTDLSLLKKVLDAIQDVEKLKSQITALDDLRMTDTEMRDALSKGDALLARTRMSVPQDLEVVKSTDIVQATSDSDVKLAVDELLNFKNANYSDSEVNSYLKQMQKVNEDVKVETEIKTVKIIMLGSEEETKLLIKKSFSYDSSEELKNVLVMEIIPKTVAGDMSGVDVKTPDYFVINEDPVVSWSYDSFGFEKQTITYAVKAADNSDSAKSTKTIILKDPSITLQEKSNAITGFSILLSKIDGMEILGLVIGIVIALGLTMYYVVFVSEIDIGRQFREIRVPKLDFRKRSAKPKHETKKKTSQPVQKAVQVKQHQSEPAVQKIEPKHKAEKAGAKEFAYLFRSDNPLRTVPSQYFHVRNGDVVRSITELKEVIEHLDALTFHYHVNDSNNDFADWIDSVYNEKKLSSLIREQKTKEELITILEKI